MTRFDIIEVDPTNRRDRRRFVEFPFRLYRGNRQWVPPLVSGEYRRFDRDSYSYYRHSDAAFFLATQGRDVLGRIAVLEPRRRNAYRDERCAFFYLFDAVDDRAVARALFDSAMDWARGRGLNHMMGPEGFIAGDGLGVLIEGFEFLPAMGIPYNAPYYDDLVVNNGFRKWTDFYSCRLSGDFVMPERVSRIAERVKQRSGLRIVEVGSRSEMVALAPKVIRAYNRAFESNPRFVPIEGDDQGEVTGRLLGVTRPDLVRLVADGDEIVGFVLGFPNVSKALQRCGGRLYPFGWALLLWDFHHTRWIDINGGGILPEYQGLGANAILYDELFRIRLAQGVKLVDLVQVNEQNLKMVRELEAVGLSVHKRHRQYEREI
ncbi:MAG: hypothetical protein GX620_09360 [Chloroflexi bacterium]|nr:hypothetical protein [Chloroflexota bacterium]